MRLSFRYLFQSIVLFILFHSLAFASKAPWFFDRYSLEQGLSQTSVTCVVQDRKGFVWVGTQGGLNRFDGYQFKIFKSTKNQQSLNANWITDCAADRQGAIWLTTATNGLAKFNPENESFTRFHQKNSGLTDNKLWSLHLDNDDNLWIGTESKGLIKFNTELEETEQLVNDEHSQSHTSVKMIRDIFQDEQGKLWLASQHGVKLFSPDLGVYQSLEQLLLPSLLTQHKSILSAPAWAINKDKNNNVWVGTKKGLAVANIRERLLHQIAPAYDQQQTIEEAWVTSIFRDKNDEMWVGTYGHGAAQFSANGKLKKHHKKTVDEPNSLSSDYIMTFFEDSKGGLWIGTDGGGFNYFDISRKQFNHQKHDSNDSLSINHSFVRAIAQDQHGYLWIGTRSGLNRSNKVFDGISDFSDMSFNHFRHDNSDDTSLRVNNIFALHRDQLGKLWVGSYGGGLSVLNDDKQNFTHYQHNKNKVDSLSSNHIFSIAQADHNHLWVGTNKGLNLFNTQTGKATRFQHDSDNLNSLSQNTVFTVLQDEKQQTWVGTRGGLSLLSADHQKFTHFTAHSKNPLSSNMVISLLRGTGNALWVGTMQGLNKLDVNTYKVTQYTEENGLLDSNIFNIEQDQQGHLWLSTNRGLTQFNPKDESFTHYSPQDGLQGNSFILGASFKAPTGHLLFGGVNGFNVFNPDELQDKSQANGMVFTDFLLANKKIINNKNGDQDALLKDTVTYTDEVTLDHTQSIFSFEFSSLHYAKPNAQKFAYKLQGFDSQWLVTDASKRIATYSNIPSGNYQLHVTSLMKNKLQKDHIKTIGITILPAPWHTWWAYSLYTLIVICIVSTQLMLLFRKREAEQERKVAHHIVRAKDTLLSNVSHEFKTPLTLILGPLNRLISAAKTEEQKKSLVLIQRNGRRLLSMVEQMLDLRELQSNKALEPKPQDIKSIVNFMFESFTAVAQEKQISFEFIDKTHEPIYLVMLPDSLEKLLGNLLSNAFKYSPNQSAILLILEIANDVVHIQLKDTGYGINTEEIQRLFDRYTRSSNVDSSITGYGIGLAIVKEVVDQHGGAINVTSKENDGTQFDISFPILSDVSAINTLSENKRILKIKDRDYKYDSEPLATVRHTSTQVDLITHQQTIVIIDDNPEIQEYLTQIFSASFHCITASGGKEGLIKAKNNTPDIIVCDVMMPEMDGFAFIETLRHDVNICHIPVLLLTAKMDRDSKLKGLNLLADDYLTKPFDEEELQIRVQRLLALRGIVSRSVGEKVINEEVDSLGELKNLTIKDREFLTTLQTVLEQHFQEHDFTIEQLAQLLCMSPRTMQIKLKALMNMTPSDYIRIYRLNRAAILLKTTALTIGQIAEHAGFNSQSYFSKCFKAKFGYGAKEYRSLSTE